MKTKMRYNSKHLSELKRVLIAHVQANLKDYLILSIIFIIGVMAGVITVNNSSEQSRNEINGYINGVVDTVKLDDYEIDKAKLTKISILENLKIVAIIWLAGTTIIGIPLIFVITSYKGFCIGYTISAIISCLGVGKRNYIFNSIIVSAEHHCYTYCDYAKCKRFKAV